MTPRSKRTMRIEYVHVESLFDVFDHVIPMNLEENVTIIHGPNGFGKTVLLQMIDGLFSAEYDTFRTIPFRRLEVGFDNGGLLTVERKAAVQRAKRARPPNLVISYRDPDSGREADSFEVPSLEYSDLEFPIQIIEDAIPSLVRLGSRTWLDRETGERLSLDGVITRYGDSLPFPLPKIKKEPEWLKNIRESIHVGFITTERLLVFRPPSDHRHRYERPPRAADPRSIVTYSKQLAETMQEKLAESVQRSSRLDRTFPMRLMTQIDKRSPSPNEEDIRDDLRALEEKRIRLMAAGLLDKGYEEFEIPEEPVDDFARNVLSVYIKDTGEKLQVFDDILERLELMQAMVGELFSYKELTISKQDGFCFKSSTGDRLPLEALSSGEQHELVLLYQLLFEVQPDSIILIDEPEISLHIAWQKQFLGNLQKITKLTSFDVLIATHSPQIVNDRWDLTVQLKGPNTP